MEITVGLFLVLLALALVCEFIDSSMGMGYGTILTPCLLILGFEPVVAVPAVLISQATGGLTAAIFHHMFKNANFRLGSRDLQMVLLVGGLGVMAVFLAGFVSTSIPAAFLKRYIGGLVLVIGVLLLVGRTFRFTWRKMIAVGIVSAFNKGVAGGGFGPVVTGGQILSGQDQRSAVGITTLAQPPICVVGFLAYVVSMAIRDLGQPVLGMPFSEFWRRMFVNGSIHWEMILALVLGSVLIAPLGAFTTKMLGPRRLHRVVAMVMVGLGAWTLVRAA